MSTNHNVKFVFALFDMKIRKYDLINLYHFFFYLQDQLHYYILFTIDLYLSQHLITIRKYIYLNCERRSPTAVTNDPTSENIFIHLWFDWSATEKYHIETFSLWIYAESQKQSMIAYINLSWFFYCFFFYTNIYIYSADFTINIVLNVL